MKFIFSIFFSVFFLNSFAQLTRLEGNVVLDSTDSPFGQFIVFSLPDSVLVKGSYIDSTYFSTEFNAIPDQEYYVKISLAGYADTLIPFKSNGELISLGTVKFSTSTLSTVDIVYKKPEFQRTMDGIKINVQGTTLQTLTSLFDVLTASPKITSPDGEKIEIIGKGSPLILIDRQPIISNDELKAIPASAIESVEIITNPSAKYKGQGSANGVIEVYTKNFTLEGYNMNISSSAGINTQLKPTASFSAGINVKRKKFSMNGHLGTNYNEQNEYGNSSGTTTDDSQRSLGTSSTSESWNSWMYYQLKAGYQINKNQKLTSGIRGHGSFGGGESNTTTEYFTGSVMETSNVSLSTPKYTWMNNSGYVNYQIETDTNKSNLEINFNLAQKASNSSGNSFNTYQNILSGIYSDFNLRTESFDRPLIGELRVNYEHVFDTSGWDLSTGLSYSQLRNGKVYNQYNNVAGEWIIDNQFSNSFDYEEHIGTVYAELSKNWDKMGFRVGVTAEYTKLDGYSNSLQKQFIDSVYIRPFPSASLLYQPNEKVGFTLYYSSGIDRPQFTNYDPFVRYDDSLSVSYGNPYLRPAVSHTIGLDMDLFYAYSLSIYISSTTDPISQISFVNDSTFFTESTPWNAKLDQTIGANLSIPFQLSWLQGWNSFWVSYSTYSFTEEFNRDPFSNLSFGLYSYLTFTLPKDFSIMNQLHVMRWGGSESVSNTQMNWGLRLTKKFMKGDFQIYADVSNIIPPKYKSTQYYGNYIYSTDSQYQFTAFKIGLFYKFGRLKQATQIKESNAGQSGRI